VVIASRFERLLLQASGFAGGCDSQAPIVDLGGCVELFVQSLQLDVSELMEPEEEVQYPVQKRAAPQIPQGSRVQEEETSHLDRAAY